MAKVLQPDRADPLVVDLDGTLLQTDMFDECVAKKIKSGRFFLEFPKYLVALFSGIAALKRELANNLSFHANALPINEPFLEYLKLQRSRGRSLYLVSASDERIVKQIGDQLGIFDGCFGSHGTTNLKGNAKIKLVQAEIATNFVYAGNSPADIPIWREATNQIFVNTPPSVRQQFSENAEAEFTPKFAMGKDIVRLLRPHQWTKNLLVILPIITSHQYGNFHLWLIAIAMMAAFSLVASGGYILNDIMDIESDRLHKRKRFRPIASGAVSIRVGFALLLILLSGGLGAAFLVNFRAGVILSIYLAATSIYSFKLKSVVLADAIILSILYTSRIVLGQAAMSIKESFWLFAFSGFFFLSLAFLKRIVDLDATDTEHLFGRGYLQKDRDIVALFGVSSGLISILVLALYIHSPEVEELYREPTVLWWTLPLMLMWISRAWLLANRGQIQDDPVVFALKDRFSYLIVGITVVIAVVARNWPW